MNKKIIPLLIIFIISLSCLSLVSADNNTTDNSTVEDIVENIEENITDYIIPIQITDNGIEFSDGFTGFGLDPSKDMISVNDKFTSQGTTDGELENHVKLAIIECYKTGHENNIQDVISQVISGNKAYDIVESVYNSTETVDDTAVVNISNDTEATFTFELLKSEDPAKSDCIGYTVSMQTIENDDVLATANEEENETSETTTDNGTDDNNTLTIAENNDTQTEQQDVNDTEKSDVESNTEKQDVSDNKTSNDNNNTEKQVLNEDNNQTAINETNKTIINKTNTVIVNENNTTIINQKNIKTINKTNETPKNTTVQDKLIKTVGNPIFLLVLVIAIIVVVAVAMRRKN